MDQQSTIRLIESYYEAFNRHDLEDFLALLTDDVCHDVNQGDREIGKDAFRAFMRRLYLLYQEKVDVGVIMATPDGSRASAEYVAQGTYQTSEDRMPEAKGQAYRIDGGAFFEIRDGLISRVTNYYNLEEWVRQVTDG